MPYRSTTLFTTQNLATVAGVALLHGVFFLCLKAGLVVELGVWMGRPINVHIIIEEMLPQESPPPSPIEIKTPPLPFIAAPEIDIELPTTPISVITTDVSAPPPPPQSQQIRPEAPAARDRIIVRTELQLDHARSPKPDDFYPAISKRLDEEGAAIVNICIGANGKITGPPKLESSTGYERLNAAALKYATATRWTPATEDGATIQSCTSIMVRFVIHRLP